jgi:hypothetical protein
MKRRTTEPVWLGAEALPGGLPHIWAHGEAPHASPPATRLDAGPFDLLALARNAARRIRGLPPR